MTSAQNHMCNESIPNEARALHGASLSSRRRHPGPWCSRRVSINPTPFRSPTQVAPVRHHKRTFRIWRHQNRDPPWLLSGMYDLPLPSSAKCLGGKIRIPRFQSNLSLRGGLHDDLQLPRRAPACALPVSWESPACALPVSFLLVACALPVS